MTGALREARDELARIEAIRRDYRLVFAGTQTLVGKPGTDAAGENFLEPVYVFSSQILLQHGVQQTPKGPQSIQRPVLVQEAVPVLMLRSVRRVHLPGPLPYVRLRELSDEDVKLVAMKILDLEAGLALAEKTEAQIALVKP